MQFIGFIVDILL